LHSDIVTAKFVLKPGIAAFCDATLVVSNCVSGIVFFFFSAPWIVVNQRSMPKATTVLMKIKTAIAASMTS
jgi:hypothetical protein